MSQPDIRHRLVHVFGAARGNELFEEILGDIDLAEIESPNDEMHFADALIARGGLMETIGRSLRVRALLRGAQVPSKSA